MKHDIVSGKEAFTAQHRFHPGRVVNICFIVVLIFSTLLTWREAVVLEDAYAASQKNHLETVANSLDRQLEFSVEKLLFFRNGMDDALEALSPRRCCVIPSPILKICRNKRSGS